MISGRRTYDISNAWGGDGPLPGAPLFVLTHSPPAELPGAMSVPYSFVSTGIGDAIAQARDAAAPDLDVALMGSGPVRQALAAGLLDQITLSVVPVLLGGGVRLVDETAAHLELIQAIDAPGVTHLTYNVTAR